MSHKHVKMDKAGHMARKRYNIYNTQHRTRRFAEWKSRDARTPQKILKPSWKGETVKSCGMRWISMTLTCSDLDGDYLQKSSAGALLFKTIQCSVNYQASYVSIVSDYSCSRPVPQFFYIFISSRRQPSLASSFISSSPPSLCAQEQFLICNPLS